jgi:uncharacterized protein DUF362
MLYSRREVMSGLLAAAAAHAASSDSKLGIPGPFPGRVVAVTSENSIVSGVYQPEIIRNIMQKGILALTGAPAWPDAWRQFVQKGDVVAIKVCPVGGPKLSSDPAVLHTIVDGIRQAGVPARDIVVFNRYRQETVAAGIDKWLPEGVRLAWAAERYEQWQLGMDGYDPDVYMEMALVKPGDNPNDVHARRSYVAQCITKQVNKVINLPVLKSHQSAGVTLCLKNLSHGMVNNVARSHSSVSMNTCGAFIPAVVSLPTIRNKVVLNIMDGIKGLYHGGPSGRPQFVWEHRTLYFGTDPVAIDTVGLKAIDAKRVSVGMKKTIDDTPDNFDHFVHKQPEHIELAGAFGLGESDEKKIDLRKIRI